MPRLKKIKFEDYNDMMSYYEENEEEIHLYTLEKLEKSWKKEQKLKTVDIYNLSIKGINSLEYMSILEDEWDLCFNEMKIYFVSKEMYEIAARVRNFEKIVFNIID